MEIITTHMKRTSNSKEWQFIQQEEELTPTDWYETLIHRNIIMIFQKTTSMLNVFKEEKLIIKPLLSQKHPWEKGCWTLILPLFGSHSLWGQECLSHLWRRDEVGFTQPGREEPLSPWLSWKAFGLLPPGKKKKKNTSPSVLSISILINPTHTGWLLITNWLFSCWI